MKISTEINSIAKKVGDKKAVLYCAKAGFDAWDFSLSNRERIDYVNNKVYGPDGEVVTTDLISYAKELKQIGLDNGIHCNQSHAAFPTHRPEVKDTLKKAIEMTAVAGGKICVVHPVNNLGPQENAKMYLELLPFAKEHDVKIATENMWNWDPEKDVALPAACCDEKSFVEHVDAVNDDYLVACLDIGHAEMEGLNSSAVGLIKALGAKRLKALHLHDNDLHYDSHELPMTMKINYVEVVKALKEIGYDGYFTLEADAALKDYTPEDVFKGVLKMSEAAKKLADMFDNM